MKLFSWEQATILSLLLGYSQRHDIRHHSGHNVVTSVMTNIVVDEKTDNAEPHSSIQRQRKLISGRDQDRDTKKEDD